ncbi:MAG: hypothetical protein QXS38_00190 [Candidatus Pacearchaeota archaeon]
MNKRGQEETGSKGALIAAVIAVVVLVIVVIGAYLFFGGKISFVKMLPSFNKTEPRMVYGEIFGYSFSDSKVKYYDGTNWIDFPPAGNLEINEKRVEYSKIKSNFETSTFFANSKSIPLQSITLRLYSYRTKDPAALDSLGLGGLSDFGNIFAIWEEVNTEYWCVLKPDDSFICQANIPSTISMAYKAIQTSLKNEALTWKKELLAKPMQIMYYDIEQKKEISGFYVCPKIMSTSSGYYIVVDLGQRKAQTDVCS